MCVLIFPNASLRCSVLFRLCLQKRRLCVILPKSGWLEALDKDECVAYHRHGRRKKAGGPPNSGHPDTICLDPGAYLHASSLHTYTYWHASTLHTLSVTLRSAWERGELYLVLHCCVKLPHIEGGEGASLVRFLNFSLSASETMWDNAQIQDRMSESGCQL